MIQPSGVPVLVIVGPFTRLARPFSHTKIYTVKRPTTVLQVISPGRGEGREYWFRWHGGILSLWSQAQCPVLEAKFS
jgi:hypothetical protein